MVKKSDDLVALFHVNSSNIRSKTVDLDVDLDNRPSRFRTFVGAKRIPLPKGHFHLRQSLGEAFKNRRSIRDFRLRRLSLERLSQLLFLSNGIRGVRTVDGEVVFDRCPPSAGGLYPVNLYVATQMVQRVQDGIYHYDPRFHRLELVKSGQFHDQLASLTIGQDMIRSANLVLMMTAVFQRTTWKYGIRGYRYVWLDAGHLGQNICLAAGGLKLGAVTIGGFFDSELNALLGLPPEETAIYLACVGQPLARKMSVGQTGG